MADEKHIISFILRHEGGYSDHPEDRGGVTNRGITLRTFRHFFGEECTLRQLIGITEAQWLHIFRNGYWIPCMAERITAQPVASMLVDWAWCSGPATAIRHLQRILGTRTDGIMGPETLSAANAADAETLFLRLRKSRLEFTDEIVRRHPGQKCFLEGWRKRILSPSLERPGTDLFTVSLRTERRGE